MSGFWARLQSAAIGVPLFRQHPKANKSPIHAYAAVVCRTVSAPKPRWLPARNERTTGQSVHWLVSGGAEHARRHNIESQIHDDPLVPILHHRQHSLSRRHGRLDLRGIIDGSGRKLTQADTKCRTATAAGRVASDDSFGVRSFVQMPRDPREPYVAAASRLTTSSRSVDRLIKGLALLLPVGKTSRQAEARTTFQIPNQGIAQRFRIGLMRPK